MPQHLRCFGRASDYALRFSVRLPCCALPVAFGPGRSNHIFCVGAGLFQNSLGHLWRSRGWKSGAGSTEKSKGSPHDSPSRIDQTWMDIFWSRFQQHYQFIFVAETSAVILGDVGLLVRRGLPTGERSAPARAVRGRQVAVLAHHQAICTQWWCALPAKLHWLPFWFSRRAHGLWRFVASASYHLGTRGGTWPSHRGS